MSTVPNATRLRSALRKLEIARGALKVISTWATFRGGEALTPKDTGNLCRRALRDSQPDELPRAN